MIGSRATAALLRLKEIDNKYKVRYDESKNDALSSVNTDSLSDKDGREENPRLNSPREKLEILKPTLNIKIPDTYAEQLDSKSSSSNEASPSPRISTTDKILVATPRVESTSEIQEALDEGESIAEILEESDGVEGVYSDKSNRENASVASSIENVSVRSEESNVDYSNDSFENDTSEAKSFNSGHSEKKDSESFVVSQKSGVREKDGISLRDTEEESIALKNGTSYTPQLSERSKPDETEIEEQSPIDEESQSCKKLDDFSLVDLNLKVSENCAGTEASGRNEDLSSPLKFVHSSHGESDIGQDILEDSKSIDKLASDDKLSTSLEAKNTPHSKLNAKPSKCSSITNEDKKQEGFSTSIEVKNTPRLKSNANLRKRSSVTDGGKKQEGFSTSIEVKNTPRSKSNAKLRKRSSVTDKGKKHEESLTSIELKNTPRSKLNAKPSMRSFITDGGRKQKQSSGSCKTAQSPPERSEPSPDNRGYSNPSDESTIDVESSKSRESVDALFKLSAKKEPIDKKSSKFSIKDRKRSKERSRVIGNEPEADSSETGSSSRRCSSREITEQRSASSDEQPEVGPAKIVENTAWKSRSTFEMRSSRDTSRIVGRKFSDRKKRGPTSGFHRRSKSKEKSLKTSKSAPIHRGKGEKSFEHGDRELERLRARMRDLRLEQERQLMLCYLWDADEERRKLMMSSRFYCPGKSEVLAIEPLDLPNVANFVKPDRTGVRCSLFFPDDHLELVRRRVEDIRQWLKDQFILYRDYSDVASAINAKYVTNAIAAEKVNRSAAARSRRGTPKVRRYRESSRRRPEVVVGLRPEEAS